MTNKKEFIEPILILAGDTSLKVYGKPLRCDCRIISEEGYQELKKAYDLLHAMEGANDAINKFFGE